MRHSLKTYLFGVAVACGAVLGASQAEACVTLQRSGGITNMFINNCGVGVDVAFTDEAGCRGYRCKLYIGRGSRQSPGSLTGHVRWTWCKSPGGPGDVTTRCSQNGNCVCRD